MPRGFIKLNALRLKLLKKISLNFISDILNCSYDVNKVFNNKHAIVIGLTPPGTGVIFDEFFRHS